MDNPLGHPSDSRSHMMASVFDNLKLVDNGKNSLEESEVGNNHHAKGLKSSEILR